MRWSIRRKASDWLEISPHLYWLAQKWRYRKQPRKRILRPDSSIMIEGYPRCANSFAVRAFRMANDPDGSMRIATHFHSPALISLAVKWRIPTIVLIRSPDEAVLSLLALSIDSARGSLKPVEKLTNAEVGSFVRYYTQRFSNFYEYLYPISSKFVASDFSETTTNFTAVIERVNEKYKTSFRLFHHTDKNVANIFANAGAHLSPSTKRNDLKNRFRGEYFSQKNRAFRQRALNAYVNFKTFNGLTSSVHELT